MNKNKILRNVCLVMAIAEACVTVRYLIDIILGGRTEWWQAAMAAVISVALCRMYFIFRARAVKESS